MNKAIKIFSGFRQATTATLSANSRRSFSCSAILQSRILGLSTQGDRNVGLVCQQQPLYFNRELICKHWQLSSLTPMGTTTTAHYSTDTTGGKKDEEKLTVAAPGVEPKLSLFQKFKKMYKEYWYVLIPVHCVTSVFWFGTFYYLAVSGVDIVPLLEKLGASEGIVQTMKNTGAGYIAVAYGMYKIATPARYTVTLGGTTISINYLRKWGYIKPVPSREKMTEMIKAKGTELRSRRAKVLAKMNLRRKGSNSTQNKQQ